MKLIITNDTAAFQLQYWSFNTSKDLVEETKFETLDYTNPREYCVFIKRPIWNILKTDVLCSTCRTWTSKHNAWRLTPWGPHDSKWLRVITTQTWNGFYDAHCGFQHFEITRPPWPCKAYNFYTSRTNSCLIVCEFPKKSSFEIYVLQNTQHDL